MRSEHTDVGAKDVFAFHVISRWNTLRSSPRALCTMKSALVVLGLSLATAVRNVAATAHDCCGVRGPHSHHPASVPVQDARHLLQGPKTQAQIQQIQAIDKGASRAAQGPRLQRLVLGPVPTWLCRATHSRRLPPFDARLHRLLSSQRRASLPVRAHTADARAAHHTPRVVPRHPTLGCSTQGELRCAEHAAPDTRAVWGRRCDQIRVRRTRVRRCGRRGRERGTPLVSAVCAA